MSPNDLPISDLVSQSPVLPSASVQAVEVDAPAPPPPKPFPGLWQSLGLLFLYSATQGVVMVPAIVLDLVFHTHIMTNPLVLAIATLASAALVATITCIQLRCSFLELIGPFRLPVRMLGPIVVTVIGQLFVVAIISLWIVRLFPALNASSERLEELLGSSGPKWAAFLLVAVVAPLCEELVFRRIFLGGMIPRFGMRYGLAFGAILFAIGHMNPVQASVAISMGLINGWWFARLGSMWPGVLAHSVNNSFSILVLFLQAPHAPAPTAHLGAEIGILCGGAVILTSAILASKRVFAALDAEGRIAGGTAVDPDPGLPVNPPE
ncbi:MAG: CPBP family intramembrane glutamic endopeptidase [Bryobacteraceae bacterium]